MRQSRARGDDFPGLLEDDAKINRLLYFSLRKRVLYAKHVRLAACAQLSPIGGGFDLVVGLHTHRDVKVANKEVERSSADASGAETQPRGGALY